MANQNIMGIKQHQTHQSESIKANIECKDADYLQKSDEFIKNDQFPLALWKDYLSQIASAEDIAVTWRVFTSLASHAVMQAYVRSIEVTDLLLPRNHHNFHHSVSEVKRRHRLKSDGKQYSEDDSLSRQQANTISKRLENVSWRVWFEKSKKLAPSSRLNSDCVKKFNEKDQQSGKKCISSSAPSVANRAQITPPRKMFRSGSEPNLAGSNDQLKSQRLRVAEWFMDYVSTFESGREIPSGSVVSDQNYFANVHGIVNHHETSPTFVMHPTIKCYEGVVDHDHGHVSGSECCEKEYAPSLTRTVSLPRQSENIQLDLNHDADLDYACYDDNDDTESFVSSDGDDDDGYTDESNDRLQDLILDNQWPQTCYIPKKSALSSLLHSVGREPLSLTCGQAIKSNESRGVDHKIQTTQSLSGSSITSNPCSLLLSRYRASSITKSSKSSLASPMVNHVAVQCNSSPSCPQNDNKEFCLQSRLTDYHCSDQDDAKPADFHQQTGSGNDGNHHTISGVYEELLLW
ncbi:hypothetical protein MP228_004191 [Amoeboaphelidium protococcarum]|nr:hypothetical protein MP228_004191 [Amoeboaphelidium protococcarum]